MDKQLTNFFALFGDHWELSFIASFFAVFLLYFKAKLKTAGGRTNLFLLVSPKEIGGRTVSAVYRKFLTLGLDWLDGKLPAEPPEQDPGWRTAWSITLYDKALLFAVAYPILSLIVYWAFTNKDGRIGSLLVLAGGADWWWRVAAVGTSGLIFYLMFYIWRKHAKGERKFGTFLFWLFAIASAAVVVGGISVIGDFTDVFTLAVIVVFSIAGAFAGALPGAFAIAIAVGFAVGNAVVGAYTGVVAVVVTVAFVFAGLYGFNRLNNHGRYAPAYLFLTILLVVGLAIVNAMAELADEPLSIMVFFGVLPLCNAIFDYLSIGATRAFLRKGLTAPGFSGWLKWTLADLGAAFVAMAALIVAIIWFLKGLAYLAGQPLIDLPAFLISVRQDHNDYWWFYVTLFSTLLPSIAHLSLAVVSLAFAHPLPLYRWVSGQLERFKRDDDESILWLVNVVLSFVWAVSVALPVILIVYAGLWAKDYHPEIGRGILYVLEKLV